jgi:hypothetical protein
VICDSHITIRLTIYRVEKYTAMMKSDLSISNMTEGRPFSPMKAAVPGSPTATATTHMSAMNLQDPFSPLPKSAMPRDSPRMHPSYSTNDVASISNGSPSGQAPPRSTSMMFMHGSGPQSQAPPPQPTLSTQPSMRMDSIVSEPRIFPGVVSKRTRKNSVQSTDTGTMGSPSRIRKVDSAGAVIEEPEEASDEE